MGYFSRYGRQSCSAQISGTVYGLIDRPPLLLSFIGGSAAAGGVICASVEYHGDIQSLAFQTIEEKICANVLANAQNRGTLPRSRD